MNLADVNPTRLATSGPERRLRVLIVDDHEVVHWGFRLMLGEQPWVERCVSAIASAALRALTQRSTHGCSPSIRRKPQCTTS